MAGCKHFPVSVLGPILWLHLHRHRWVRLMMDCPLTFSYTNIPLIISWQAAANPNESQRATALGYL
jgi:hypothetical protein